MRSEPRRADTDATGEARPGISIVFPMYNEREYVRKTVDLALRTLRTLTNDYEIVIVDDASTDGCGEIADALARENDRVRVVHHTVNGKLGTTLRTAFANARKELVIYSDMDLPFDFNEIPKALRVMTFTECDIVTVYRHDRTSEGFIRTIYSFAYNLIIRFLFGVRVRDINFAFKVIRSRVLRSISLTSRGSFIDAELIIQAHRAGFRIEQFGIDYFARAKGQSNLATWSNIAVILREMTAFRLRLWRSGR